MRDIVKIESEFTKNMILGIISRVLKNKKDINIDIQFDEFHVENNGGRLSIHIDANAEISEEDLEKILNQFHKFQFLKKTIMEFIMGALNKRFIQNIIENKIKKILKKDIDVKINDLKCCNRKSAAYVHLNADAEMPEEELKMMLEDAKLL